MMIFPILRAKTPEEGVAERRLRAASPHESQRMVTKPLSLSKYANLETSGWEVSRDETGNKACHKNLVKITGL